MNKRHWPQRDFFRNLVDTKVEAGITKEEQARGIGIAYSSLVTHYSGDREPGKATLKKMAAYYETELAYLTDDPGVPIPGVDLEISSKMSPAKRLVMRSVAQKLAPDDVQDESAENVLKAVELLIPKVG